MAQRKIKILDSDELREILHLEYKSSSQVKICKFALLLANHILELINYPDINNETIQNGFLINQQWQEGKVRMHDVRQVGFKIHQMAKKSQNDIICNALRVVGHAVSTGHMKEHGMVASDYAIKVINLLNPQNIEAVKTERCWQINHLKQIQN